MGYAVEIMNAYTSRVSVGKSKGTRLLGKSRRDMKVDITEKSYVRGGRDSSITG
jgi:hypothetical protein